MADGGTITRVNGSFNSLGNITLRNGAHLTSADGQNPTVNSFSLNGDITVEGTSGSFIDTSGTTNNAFHLATGVGSGNITFTVADTGDTTADLTVSASLRDKTLGGAAGITKAGDGKMVLTAANTYSGATAVNGGMLMVNNSSGSATGTGAVSVASGATLAGTGTISGAVTITGKISPGDGGISTLNTGGVTWNGAATAGVNTDWEFALGTGNTADKLNITGNFTKGSGSVFNFDFLGSAFTGIFTLAQWTGSTTFSSGDFSYSNLGGGYSGSFTINGSTLQFTAVPEPTSALAGLLLGAGLLRRRRPHGHAKPMA